MIIVVLYTFIILFVYIKFKFNIFYKNNRILDILLLINIINNNYFKIIKIKKNR
jgi:hypothetical protein